MLFVRVMTRVNKEGYNVSEKDLSKVYQKKSERKKEDKYLISLSVSLPDVSRQQSTIHSPASKGRTSKSV